MFWLREAHLLMLPWTALISLALPLPLKHAVWAQAAAVLATLAGSPHRNRLSTALCADSPRHYSQLARLLTMAVVYVLPGQLRSLAVEQSQRVPFVVIDSFLNICINYALVLLLLCRWELRQRQAFVRQHRLASLAAALLRRKKQWRPTYTTLLLGACLLWMLCLACTTVAFAA